jgi:hypothetical protein
MMPDELAFELDQLDVSVVDFADDLRAPHIRESIEALFDVDLSHGCSFYLLFMLL